MQRLQDFDYNQQDFPCTARRTLTSLQTDVLPASGDYIPGHSPPMNVF